MTDLTRTMDQAVKAMVNREGKYLTFSLDQEDYGISILKVKEIIGMMRVTPVPQTPEHVKGVINLRGKVIPVIDLRIRFGMSGCEYTERTCIVVVETDSDTGKLQIGIVVDSVSEVLRIPKETVEPPPRLGKVEREYVSGVGKLDNRLLILLDVDRLMGDAEQFSSAAMAQA